MRALSYRQSVNDGEAEEVCGNGADGIAAAAVSRLSCALSSNIRWPAKENREKQSEGERGVYVGQKSVAFAAFC